jgi:hypothetical protein
MAPRKTTIWLLLILLLCFIVRVGYVSVLRQRMNELVVADMRTYNLLATNLIEKQIYGLREGSSPWRSYRPPLYPFFLSLIYRGAGYHFIAIRIAQAFLAGLSGFLLYLLARELAGVTTALIASLIFAVDFSLIHLSGLLLSENLYLPLSLIVILLLVRGFRAGVWNLFIGAGIAGGLAALCRPTILPFLALSFLAPVIITLAIRLRCRDHDFLPDKQESNNNILTPSMPIRRVMGGWLLMIFCAGLVILPWTARNYRIHHAFVPISTNGGTMLWMGLHPGASGGYDWPAEDNPLLAVSDEVERNRIGIHESIKFIFNHPREFMELAMLKMKFFWRGYLFTWSGRQWALIGLSGMVGLLLSLRDWRKWLLLYIYLLSFTGLHLFVHSSYRYRLPLNPLMEIWAAVFLVFVWRKIRPSILKRKSVEGINNCETGI